MFILILIFQNKVRWMCKTKKKTHRNKVQGMQFVMLQEMFHTLSSLIQ
jgi:hypothetical protein